MSAKKKPTPAAAAPSEMVQVRALAHLFENDTHHKKGEVFELPAARAAVLPELVLILES